MRALLFTTSLSVLVALSCSGSPSNPGNSSDVATAGVGASFGGAGQLGDLITNHGAANGGWWLYKFYGDMSGMMAMTTPPPTAATAVGLDGVASIDATAKNVQLIFGGAAGNNAITIQGLDSAPFFACTAHVKAETTPWNGVNSAVAAPTTLFEADYPINNGLITVTLNGMNATSGYRLTITPS
jgi:hypothetical protein